MPTDQVHLWLDILGKAQKLNDVCTLPKRHEAMKKERKPNIFLLFQQLDYGDSSVSIQSRGGLIQKQQLWFYDQLHTNVGTLSLTN